MAVSGLALAHRALDRIAALASLRESIPPRRMCGADHGDACDCLDSDPCTCGGGHTNVDGNGGHALGCPARAVASVCHTSPAAPADTQTPHNAMAGDESPLAARARAALAAASDQETT